MSQNCHGEEYDVAVIGTGLVGTILAAILAAQGIKVVMVESGVHPRFAIGESIVPATGSFLRILALRYGVPEIKNLSNFTHIRRHVSSACGIKRSFTFVHHTPGREPDPEHTTQVLTARPPFGPDCHMFRQDVDAYMLAIAVRYGARLFQNTRITGLERSGPGWRIETQRGPRIAARYLVDGSGARSFLADHFGLRETPTGLQTHSRSLFTHMVGVKPYERSRGAVVAEQLASPPSQGTLHHIFDGGWLWVIPFDNHAHATNPLCSVGLQLDPRRFPRDEGEAPGDEFRDFLSRFPGIASQFEGATAIRDWVATDRLQYSSTTAFGDGFCLLPHAAGFVDPLYSSGLATSLSTVNSLAWRLIKALRDDDLSAGRFAYVNHWLLSDLRHVDRMVAGSYSSFQDFELWNAWFRVFATGAILWNFGLIKAYIDYLAKRDPAVFAVLEEAPNRGALASDLPQNMETFSAAAAEMEAVLAGRKSKSEAAGAIFDQVSRSTFLPPHFKLANPAHRVISIFRPGSVLRLLRWSRTHAPREVSKTYFDFPLKPLLSEVLAEHSQKLARMVSSLR